MVAPLPREAPQCSLEHRSREHEKKLGQVKQLAEQRCNKRVNVTPTAAVSIYHVALAIHTHFSLADCILEQRVLEKLSVIFMSPPLLCYCIVFHLALERTTAIVVLLYTYKARLCVEYFRWRTLQRFENMACNWSTANKVNHVCASDFYSLNSV